MVFISLENERTGRVGRGAAHMVLAFAIAGLAVAPQTFGNGDRLYLDCPCRLASDGATLTFSIGGARSFRTTDSGPLRLEVERWRVDKLDEGSSTVARSMPIADSLDAGARMSSVSVDVPLESVPDGSWTLSLALYEQGGEQSFFQDRVFLESEVDLADPFDVGDLDYLRDSDGDGVGDLNEEAEQTDPEDSRSTPGASTIDLLALYSQGFPDLFDGDPTTRVQHVVTLANVVFDDSGLAIQLRLVGTAQVAVDEHDEWARPEEADLVEQVRRHGSDLTVLFRPSAPNAGTCGWSYVGGFKRRGWLRGDVAETGISTVMGMCSGRTLAHELGHALGLGHTYWQNSIGTYRWSRGHAIDDDFYTIMSYGGRGGHNLEVFSDPDASCRGRQETDRPCGEDMDDVAGADAVTSLNAVRFQAAAFRDGYPDSDGDGFVNPVDDLPGDPNEWLDTDGDGIGDNADEDDDGDGVKDPVDAFPLDGTETVDSDGDGRGDNSDPFPEDPDEWADTDGDGVGDNADAFPDDPGETADSDGDGVGDNGDLFPNDPDEWSDTDGDGVGDNSDVDTDGDGVVNEADLFPLDPGKADIVSYVFVAEGSDTLRAFVATGGEHAYVVIGAPGNDSRRGAVYVIAAADLASIDAADGSSDREIDLANVASGTASWKIAGEGTEHFAGWSAASADDLDGDGTADLVVGAYYYSEPARGLWAAGAVYFVSGASLSAADAADGKIDGNVSLGQVPSQPGSWKIVGNRCANLGFSVVAEDLDGDGGVELILGARQVCDEEQPGSAYIVALDDLVAGDVEDGAEDGVVYVENAVDQPASYRLRGETGGDRLGETVGTIADINDDGRIDIGIGAPHARVDGHANAGIAYLVSTGDLATADAADGDTDGTVELGRITGRPGSWKVTGGHAWDRLGRWIGTARAGELLLEGESTHIVSAERLTELDAADEVVDGTIAAESVAGNSWALRYTRSAMLAGDVDGDGSDDMLFADSVGVYLFEPEVLAELDETDDATDRTITSWHIASDDRTWSLRKSVIVWSRERLAAGDVDADGQIDLLLTERQRGDSGRPDRVYLVSGADLAVLDRVDGDRDLDLRLGNVGGDTDGDGVGNTLDSDDDNDGHADILDRFPLDPTEWADTDGDGYGNNEDAFPDDWREQFDTDGDGIGNNADVDDDGDGIADSEDARPLDTDNDGLDNREDSDDDDDGVSDDEDDLPIDPSESVDTDGDGIGNNADEDDDNDGVSDAEDDFPLDATESADADGDGIGDNADVFPDDPDEQSDADGDGTGDNADLDDDNDGIPDTEDAFPYDPNRSSDTDGDGVDDSRDAFPEDPAEFVDTDGDGIGNNADPDDDNDGVADAKDLFPLDSNRWGLTSLKFVPESDLDRLGAGVAGLGDLDGDGRPELLLGAPDYDPNGAAYLVSSHDIRSADEADGTRDGIVSVEHVARQPYSWKLLGEDGLSTGEAMSSAGDLNGDDVPEFVLGAKALVGAVFVVSSPDLLAADADDGEADGVVALKAIADFAASWRLGGAWGGNIGSSIGGAPGHVFVGQPGGRAGDAPGTAHLLTGAQLSVVDAGDGDVDGRMSMYAPDGPWLFTGENSGDRAGSGLAAADFDSDGRTDVAIGAPGHDAFSIDDGAVYVVGSRDFEVGVSFELAHAAAGEFSYKIVGEGAFDRLGSGVAVGDVDGDGEMDLVLGAESGLASRAIVNIVSGSLNDLLRLDAEDGSEDGLIRLANKSRIGHWRIPYPDNWWWGRPRGAVATVDSDGDGRADLLLPLVGGGGRAAFVLLPGVVVTPEGSSGGSAVIETVIEAGYSFHAEEVERRHSLSARAAGDVDGDGLEDFLLGVVSENSSVAYLIVAADLPLLDVADGRLDKVIQLMNVAGSRR